MAQYRALLVGASAYEARGIHRLPFVPHDLMRLGSALRGRGFSDVEVVCKREGGKQISANFINARVSGFLRRARTGDVLFILLSGYGVHANGRDYLIPEDIDEDTDPFVSGCVAIDWGPQLDRTLAERVVILIDACREGIEQDVMGVADVRQWGLQRVQATLRRKLAYVYACSPGQLSLFVGPHESATVGSACGTRPGESFSLFSRAVRDVVVNSSGTPSLGEFRDRVQDRVTELHRAYHKKGAPQLLRVVTDIPAEEFTVLPRAVTQSRTGATPTPLSAPPVLRASVAVPPKPFRPPRPTLPPVLPTTRQRKHWARYSALGSALIALVALGLYEGYQWTQSQYYVGVKDSDHVAVYQGVNQDLAWISLSRLYQDHPEIELKYLPVDQRSRVMATIAVDSRDQALLKARELSTLAGACKKDAERKKSGTSSPTLTEAEEKLAPQCSAVAQ